MIVRKTKSDWHTIVEPSPGCIHMNTGSARRDGCPIYTPESTPIFLILSKLLDGFDEGMYVYRVLTQEGVIGYITASGLEQV